ncbi:MAG: hypothetical protein M3460_25320 [Actinomycetota bacterium]|nr:hypothetical protein [Actinomycetota bacterium]
MGHWLLIRRQITTLTTVPELTLYRCAGAAATTIAHLIHIAGAGRQSRSASRPGKNKAGLDPYQVRHYTAGYRHITLAMLAATYLAVTPDQETKKGTPQSNELISLTTNEIRLLAAALAPRTVSPSSSAGHTDDDASAKPPPATTAAAATDPVTAVAVPVRRRLGPPSKVVERAFQ